MQEASKEEHSIVVISDVHIGIKSNTKNALVKFLENIECETLVLNGDIVDGQRLNFRPKRKLTKKDVRIIEAITGLIEKGTKVFYIPGNHDEALRGKGLYGKNIKGINFAEYLIHTSDNGKRFFISHGDQFEESLQRTAHVSPHLLSSLDLIYEGAIYTAAAVDKFFQFLLRKPFNKASSLLDRVYKGIEHLVDIFVDNKTGKRASLKHIFNNIKHIPSELRKAKSAGDAFKKAATDWAREKNFDGIVCGHTHHPGISKTDDGIMYANSGDWIYSFTALTANKSGDWELIYRGPGYRRKFNATLKNKATGAATEEIIHAIRKTWPGNRQTTGSYSAYKGVDL